MREASVQEKTKQTREKERDWNEKVKIKHSIQIENGLYYTTTTTTTTSARAIYRRCWSLQQLQQQQQQSGGKKN